MAIRLSFLALAVALTPSCGSTPGPGAADTQPGAEPAAAERAQSSGTESPAEGAGPDGSTESRKPDSPPQPPVLAVDSTPPGVEPLSEGEETEMQRLCKPVADAVAQAANKDRNRQEPAAYVEQVLSGSPVMGEREFRHCGKLIRRDMLEYQARQREAEAINHLKRIVVGMSTAMAGAEPRLCPSAPPVPADHRSLAKRPYRSKPADWQAEGWGCVRFDLRGAPQRFQYELSTDPKTQSFEIIARGYPVDGGPVVELYLPGKVEDGAIQPTSNVYRRRYRYQAVDKPQGR